MKKQLLFLGLLGLATQVRAQGPWTLVNYPNSNILTQYNINDIHTLSPTVAWGVTSDKVATGAPAAIPNTFIRTNNAAGDEFDFNSVTLTTDGAVPTAHSATLGNISGVNDLIAVAAAYPGSTFVQPTNGSPAYGGEIRKTINGGTTWVNKTVGKFVGDGSFCNWVHMFNATTGVALGDPTGKTATNPGAFEILRTVDGGETWNRLTAGVPTPLLAEYGNAGAFYASTSTPGTLWTGLASANSTDQVRVFKTTDFGLTWTASAVIPNIIGAVSQLTFKSNNLDGIAYGYVITGSGSSATVTGINYARTSDGGQTWSPFTPVNTATGSFFRNAIDAVGNTYYSTGPRYPVPTTGQVPEDFGFSSSADGINWTNITVSGTTLNNPGYFFCMDLIAGPTPNSVVGYGGLYTDVNGLGGVYKYSRTVTATRNAALQSALNVYPNPSASGLFSVDLGSELKTGAQLIVSDALGRQVKSQTLNAAAIGSRKISLDLSGEKTGVYTLQIRTDAGLATQKLVIE
ncbi:hypothetical protein GCM10028822_10250 [Hymenobacter terrigena]